MSLLNELHEASLDSIPFLISSADTKGGRRQAKFEYISTDRRQVQDLGRYLREFQVTGYLQNNPQTGQNYFENRDALLAKLESDGVRILRHPFYGQISVTTGIYSLKEDINKLGCGIISFTATQISEEIENSPLPKTNERVTSKSVANKAQEVDSKLNSDSASKFSLVKKFKSAYQSAKDIYTNTLDQIQKVIQPLAEDINDAANFAKDVENDVDQVNTYLNNPSSLFGTIIDKLSGINGLTNNINQSIAGLKRFDQFGDALNNFGTGVPTTDQSGFAIENLSPFVRVPQNPITVKEDNIKSNADLLTNTVKQSALINIYSLSAQVDYESVQDIDEIEQYLEDRYNELRESIGDTVYEDFAELRQLSRQLLDNKRLTTATIRTIDLKTITPLSVVSYRVYEDSTRATEIQDLNNITDIINVKGNIEVLTDVTVIN